MKLPIDPRLPIVNFDAQYLRQLNARLYEIFREISNANNLISDGFVFEMTPVSSDYTVTTVDQVLLVNNSAPVTITLPAATDTENKRFVVKKISNNGHSVSVVSSSGLIEDVTAKSLAAYESCEVVSDGSAYWLI
jgi:hypothetical protein